MLMDKTFNVKRELVFRTLFGSNENKDILADFLQPILEYPKEKFEKIEILNPYLFESDIGVKIKTNDDEYLDVDIQLKEQGGSRRDDVISALELFGVGMGENNGEFLHDSKKKRCISIVIYPEQNVIEESKNYHETFSMRNSESSFIFTNSFEVHTLEICKIPKDDNSKLAMWLRLLDIENNDLESIAKQGKEFKKACEIIKALEV